MNPAPYRPARVKKGLPILEVEPASIAEAVGLAPGDVITGINGKPVADLLDYQYVADDQALTLLVRRPDGETWEVDIEREPGERLGLQFEAITPRECGNDCVFCFVHQNPPGMRAGLSIKDEDYRLSFLDGHFVTLTNLSPRDIERIATMRLSPLYVSVHTTDPELRRRMLGRKDRPDNLMERLGLLLAAKITVHAQVVLCPGWNDGEALEQTLADLAGLNPGVASVAVVPLGLTKHREHLPALTPVTPAYARAFIEWLTPRQARFLDRFGVRFAYAADEFYLMADLPVPPLAAYDDLPQVGNGVGMVAQFRAEAARVLGAARRAGRPRTGPVARGPRQITAVTGVLAAPIVRPFVEALGKAWGLPMRVEAVENRFYGSSIRVAGLLTGGDVLEHLTGSGDARPGDRSAGLEGHLLVVPDVMLKADAPIFLDDLSLAALGQRLAVEALAVPATPRGLVDTLKGRVAQQFS
jgi:putative radical SAM enzyme (TIGR03279 family)